MKPIKFKNNRVRRNYKGGKELDKLQGIHPATDSDQPEEWIASLVTATNEGLPDVENEGLSITEDRKLFDDLIKKNPQKMLGEKHYSEYGLSLAYLAKLIDSSMRLHTQAHPTREFARENLESNWGKFECYYVLKIRNNDEGYIRLGFQNAPTKAEWKEIIETQDIERMNNCFEKVPIKEGDIIYIPGGVPHAIGENVLLVEILEPSDLVVRCEFEREGIVLPEEGRFMERGLSFCLDIFDYTQYSVEDIKDNFFLEKKTVLQADDFTIYQLVPAEIAQTFEVFSIELFSSYELILDERFFVGLNVSGSVEISYNNESITVEEGESFFVSSDLEDVTFQSLGDDVTELCVISNVL